MVVVEFSAEHGNRSLWETVQGRVVELVPVIPFEGGTVPLVSVADDTRGRRESDLRSHPSVDDVESLAERDSRSVFRVTWADVPIHGIEFEGVDGHFLRAVGRAEGWEFTVVFGGQDALTAFWETIREAGLDVTVDAVKTSSGYPESASKTLSDQQRETLRRAVERGYYDVPRRCTVSDLAKEFDISDQAVSERLRRGSKLLVERSLSEHAV